MTVRVAIWGADGRMGRALADVCDADPDAVVAFGVDQASGVPADAEADVVIDFSTPDGSAAAIAWARRKGVPIVSGTTGNFAQTANAFRDATAEIPVLQAANMSLGVAVMRALVRTASSALPLTFHPELAEIHHRRKVDAPSGTALALADDVHQTRGISACITGRSGAVGERTTHEIGVMALRGGDVVGDHTMYFFGEGERLEITHRATDRRIFARGAVTAAKWLVGKPAGTYTIEDVLGLA